MQPGPAAFSGDCICHAGCDRPKMGRRAPSLLINQVRRGGVACILKLQMHRHQGDSHLLPPPNRSEHMLICQSDRAPLLSLP